MAILLDIKNDIRQAFEGTQPEVARICFEIAGYIANEKVDARLHLTLSLLRRRTHPGSDTELLLALQYLTGVDVNLLEAKFEFVADDGEYIPLTSGQVAAGPEAVVGALGLVDFDSREFESRVLVYFSPSDRARAAMQEQVTA